MSKLIAQFQIETAEDMHEFGKLLGGQLRAGDLVVLTGPLGAGKTTFSRGVGEALQTSGTVSSPTFVIARTHKRQNDQPPLVHVDAYRLSTPAELDDLDIDFDHSITLVEWGRGFTDGLVEQWLDLEIERDQSPESDVRLVRLIGHGDRWDALQVPSA